MKRDEATLSAVLERAGLLRTGVPEQDMKAQLAVLLNAMDIYAEREAHHHQLWKEMGYTDSAHHLRSKAARVGKSVSMDTAESEEAVDEAIDAINYAAFFVQNSEAGRRGE